MPFFVPFLPKFNTIQSLINKIRLKNSDIIFIYTDKLNREFLLEAYLKYTILLIIGLTSQISFADIALNQGAINIFTRDTCNMTVKAWNESLKAKSHPQYNSSRPKALASFCRKQLIPLHKVEMLCPACSNRNVYIKMMDEGCKYGLRLLMADLFPNISREDQLDKVENTRRQICPTITKDYVNFLAL